MSDHPRIMEAICAEPWAITESALRQIAAIAQGSSDMHAVALKRAERLQNAERAGVRDGVAVIGVTGPVFRYANLFTEMSGATALAELARDLQVAVEDPSVRAILLNMDTPGGQATGIAEFSAAIRAATERKPVWAYVGDMAASAGYWMATGASRIVSSRTGTVGSVGALLTVDVRKDDNRVEIVSSQSPNKRADVTTEAGRAQVQQWVDALAGVFIADVAKHRGTTEANVLETYGQGGIVFAPDALKVGMVDALGSFESTLAELSRTTSGTRRSTRSATMSTASGGNEPVTYTQDQLNAAVATARTEEQAKVTAAVTGERARIKALQALTRPGFESVVAEGIDKGYEPGAVALAIMTAAADRGITLEGIRKDSATDPGRAPPPADDKAKAGRSWDEVQATTTPKRM